MKNTSVNIESLWSQWCDDIEITLDPFSDHMLKFRRGEKNKSGKRMF